MENLTHLLIVAGLLAAPTFTVQLTAHDAPLPPRLKTMQQERRTVAGTTSDALDRKVHSVSPRGLQTRRELDRVANAQPNADLAHASRSALPPKLEELQRERVAGFVLAPLK